MTVGRSHPASGRLVRELVGSPNSSVPALLRGRTEATPDGLFLRWGETAWSYAQALAASEHFAGFLRASGCHGPGSRVMTYLSNRPEALWAWFGTGLAGATFVPLNRSHRGAILQDMIRRAGAKVLVTEVEALAELPDLRETAVEHVVVVGRQAQERAGSLASIGWDEAHAAECWSGELARPGALGAILYTSGSTGRSKAVCMPHNEHCRGGALVAESLGLEPTDVWHCWPPLYHVFAQIYVIVASIAAGGTVALQPRFSRSRYWAEVADVRATVVGGTANVMRRVWKFNDEDVAKGNSIRLALISGAFADLHDSFSERYGLTIVDCYGMTEAEPMTLPLAGHSESGCHGLPSPDFELAVFDDYDQPVVQGEVGEIVSRPRVADVMFQGYEDDADQTTSVWRNLWFHTGDLGYLDADGFLHFLDRRKHGIRRLGENISTWEIEAQLIEHPSLASVVAVGVPGDPGEEDVKIVAVLAEGQELRGEELFQWCQKRMAKFMLPRYIEFVEVLPVLTFGKVNRNDLAYVDERVWDASSEKAHAPVKPR